MNVVRLQTASFLFIGILITIFGIGCTNPFESNASKPYKVKVLTYDQEGKLQFEEKTLETLEDPVQVEGSEIKVRMNSKFHGNLIEDQIPRAMYRVSKDGVILPTDVNSFMFYGLYYNMEQLLKFDKQLGLAGLLQLPRVVSVQTEFFKVNNGVMRLWKNNLSYLPGYDRIVIYKFEDSNLPAQLNLGLLAHEHFHALFEALVKPHEMSLFSMNDEIRKKFEEILLKQAVSANSSMPEMSPAVPDASLLDSESQKLFEQEKLKIQQGPKGYNFLVLNSLSEGFADFWAWLVTGQELPSDMTFKDIEALKDLDFSFRKVSPEVLKMYPFYVSKEDFNFAKFQSQETSQQSDRKLTVRQNFYIYGAMYAKLARAVVDVLNAQNSDDSQKRISAGLWMIGVLKNLRNNLEIFQQTKDQDEYLTQDLILTSFLQDSLDQDSLQKICGYFKSFLEFTDGEYSKITKCEGL